MRWFDSVVRCVVATAAIVGGCWGTGALRGESPIGGVIEPRPVDRIRPGVIVFDDARRGYSDLILFVRGRLAAGDLDAVSETVRYYADLFNMVYLADVRRGDDGYELESVAVGFSTKIDRRDVVVDSATAEQLGLRLNLIGKGVLSGNEQTLAEVMLMARNRHCAVIDAPAVMLHRDRHQKMVVRFFIWVSAKTGKVGTTAWLLERRGDEFAFAHTTFEYLPPGLVDDRIMHVDGGQFTLGIPSRTAFAMTSIPKGRSFPVTDRLREVGRSVDYDQRSFHELITSVAAAMGQR